MGGGAAVRRVCIRVAVVSLCVLLLACAQAVPRGGLPRLTAEDMDPAMGYESPPTLRASDLFPPEVVASQHHEVREEVATDGFFRIYVIDSEFGRFEAAGDIALRQRVQEILDDINTLLGAIMLSDAEDSRLLSARKERIGAQIAETAAGRLANAAYAAQAYGASHTVMADQRA